MAAEEQEADISPTALRSTTMTLSSDTFLKVSTSLRGPVSTVDLSRSEETRAELRMSALLGGEQAETEMAELAEN
jgi:hypothetical protein